MSSAPQSQLEALRAVNELTRELLRKRAGGEITEQVLLAALEEAHRIGPKLIDDWHRELVAALDGWLASVRAGKREVN